MVIPERPDVHDDAHDHEDRRVTREEEATAFSVYVGNVIIYILYLFTILIEVALIFRIFFRLFAANPGAPFVSFIYDTTTNLLYPFRGIFQNQVIGQNSVLDISALFGFLVYLVILFVLEAIIRYFNSLTYDRRR